MARRWLAGVVVAVALGGVAQAAGDQLPILRSATVLDRRVVLEVAVSDLRPEQLTVATSRAVDAGGALIRRDVRLREAIELAQPAIGVVRWQSRTKLVPGIYFVQVMAVDTGGVTDCLPRFQRTCLEHWSNVRRVVVAASR
jgi:hypothetical protein